MRKSSYLFRLLAVIVLTASTVLPTIGQIGYQLAVLDQETGSPKRNASVSVDVTISDSKGNTVFNKTYNETTNDFGMVSLHVGDADTFSSMNWQNLPLFISATIDGSIEVGRSQILTVPVAEYAKTTGVLTKELLCSKTWSFGAGGSNLIFHSDGTMIEESEYDSRKYAFYIDGNTIYCSGSDRSRNVFKYIPELNGFVELQHDGFFD